MKKTISALLSLVMVLSILLGMAVPTYAEVSQIYQTGDYQYKVLENNTAQITEYTGSEIEITIPEKLDNYTITSIGDHTFERNEFLESVTIPGCITDINSDAFTNCTALTSVNMLYGVKNIGYNAFAYCPKLVNVTIPNSVVSLDGFSFCYCESLENIVIPNSVTSIGADAFEGCISLKNITISSSITNIGSNAFKYCVGLENVYCCILEEDWKKVSVGNGNEYLLQANINLHTWKNSTITKEPNCMETGLKTCTCSVCNETYDEVLPKTGHKYGLGKVVKEPKCSKPGLAVYTCENCAKTMEMSIPALDYHTYDNGVYKVKPTCKESGVKTYTCTGCGYSYDTTVAPSYDSHTFTQDKYREATCHSTGIMRYTCKTCKYVYTETIPMKQHRYGYGVTTKISNCQESGIITYTCTGCGDTYTETTKKKSHFYNREEITKQPTCHSTGEKTFTCSDCNSIYIEVLPVTEHTYNDGVVTKKPTCETVGIKTYTCTKCGSAYTEIIDKTNHCYEKTAVQATLNKDGKITEACKNCKKIKSTEAVMKIASVALSNTTYTYNGKVQTPTVTVKDSKGKALKKDTDYTVSYASGRKNVGRYAVTITFKGNYSGTKTLYYNIAPQGTKVTKLTARSKGFVVQWATQKNQTTGYQIQYSTSSNFSNATTVTMPKNTYYARNITGRAGGKKHYVRVRTYKTIKFNGKNYNIYSGWSETKTVTTKR